MLPNPTNSFDPYLYNQLPEYLKWATALLNQGQLITTLFALMALDVTGGIIVAFLHKKLSSNIAWRGMGKKVFTLIIIGMCAAIEPFAGGIPMTKMAAIFYMVAEGLSILENAAAIGVPFPTPVRDALIKLKLMSEAKVTNAGGGSPTLQVSMPAETHIDIKTNAKPEGPTKP